MTAPESLEAACAAYREALEHVREWFAATFISGRTAIQAELDTVLVSHDPGAAFLDRLETARLSERMYQAEAAQARAELAAARADVKRLERERDEALSDADRAFSDYQDLGRRHAEECKRLERELARLREQGAEQERCKGSGGAISIRPNYEPPRPEAHCPVCGLVMGIGADGTLNAHPARKP